MANSTNKIINETFEQMIEEMPFDKITASAIIQRSNVSRNTFYNHYKDIYDLLNKWMINTINNLIFNSEEESIKLSLKRIAEAFQTHPKIVRHIKMSLSKEILEDYIYNSTGGLIEGYINSKIEGHKLSENQINEITIFVRYSLVGFFVRFADEYMDKNCTELIDIIYMMIEKFVDSSIYAFENQK